MVTRRFDIAGRLEPVAFGIVLALHLVPVWTVHYFPTQDGPAHVYNTAQFLTLLAGDPLLLRDDATNLHPFPNWTTTVLYAGFLRIVSAVTAEKFVVSLYVLGLPLSARYLLTGRRAGAGWLGWLTLPLVYNDFLHRGFYNFLLGIVVMCLVVGYWLRHRSRPSPARLATFCALATLLYFLPPCRVRGGGHRTRHPDCQCAGWRRSHDSSAQRVAGCGTTRVEKGCPVDAMSASRSDPGVAIRSVSARIAFVFQLPVEDRGLGVLRRHGG